MTALSGSMGEEARVRVRVLPLILALVVLAAPLVGEAQQTVGIPRIGVISPSSATAAMMNIAALKDGLHQLGYVEGQTIALDIHFADGDFDRLPAVISEFTRTGVRVLVVGGTTPAIIVHRYTAVVPIVFVSVSDPVGAGLALSLGRPGRNATGMATAHEEAYAGKALELLKEAVLTASRVALLRNPANRSMSASGRKSSAQRRSSQ
jgi:putative tryptophan/tyrosine transport system substrate-binding protein